MRLWTAMQELDFPKKVVNVIHMFTTEGLRGKVRVEHKYSDTFEINNEQKPKDALSSQLFNSSTLQAVGVDLIANNRMNMKEAFSRFQKEAEKIGLLINEN